MFSGNSPLANAMCAPGPSQYTAMYQMPPQGAAPYGDEADGIVTTFGNLVRVDSMDVSNDPRFFTPNVLDKRFAAFSALSICSTLFTGTALKSCFEMEKDWDFMDVDGVMHFIGFVILNVVLFQNVLASFTSVAQIYLTYRLMTAGPTGFEIASSFYLNPNIAFWRHAAVKQMLVSLPLFLLASAFRIFVRIDKEMPGATPPPSTMNARWLSARISGVSLLAIIMFCTWTLMAMLLYYVNCKHLSTFKERYTMAKDMERPLLTQVKMLSERSQRPEC